MDFLRVSYVDFPSQFQEEKDEILPAIKKVLEKGDFILGAAVEEFEHEFAELCGTDYAVAVANGTDSLILAMKALGIGSGDEVITAPNSWVSSASSIALIGATPVFADVGPDQNIDPKEIEKKITSRTKAIMPVHLTGRMAAMEEINKIGLFHNIPIIEDAAQAILARRGDLRSGGSSLMASFSLHPLKNLNAVGDAGILTTNNKELKEKLTLLRHHGLKNRDEVVFWGFNSRLDTLQAAVLLTRMKHLPQIIETRRSNAKLYLKLLDSVVMALPIESMGEFHTYHTFTIQCERRNELQAYLLKRGIETKIHYPIPIHLQEAAKYLNCGKGSYPHTETQSERILSLPVHQYLKVDQIEWTAECIRTFYKGI